MSEISAAAERRRKHQEARVSMESPYYDSQLKEPWPYSRQLDKDAAELSDAYLAEHPADDATPLDESWLRSVGTASTLSEKVYGYYFRCGGFELNVCRDQRQRWLAELRQDESHVDFGEIKTRGQLRDLARVLGIPLTGDVQ